MQAVVLGDGGIDVRGPDADALPDSEPALGREGHVLVRAEPDLRAVDRGVAVVHGEGLEPAVGDRVLARHRDHASDDEERLRILDSGIFKANQKIEVGRLRAWVK